MTQVREIAAKVRSKNAGPFWLTVDIFCGSQAAFDRLATGLTTEAVAAAFKVDTETLKRFDIAELHAIKFSLPRPEIQGAITDRDLHGASFGEIVAALEIAG